MFNWWRKRQGILKEKSEPHFNAVLSINGDSGVVYSSLTLETVCERFRESFPPPVGFIWSLLIMTKSSQKLYYHYHFRLKEKNENKTCK